MHRDDDIDVASNELGCEFGEAFRASFGPAILDRDGMTLDPSELAQPLYECSDPLAPDRSRGRAEEADRWQLRRLLRPRRERRPQCRREGCSDTTEKRIFFWNIVCNPLLADRAHD